MTGKTGVIYLLKDRFQFYSPFLRQIVEFKFTPQMVLDLDVLNPELLEEQIKVFVTNGKIPPSNLIIILADNAYFVKDFALHPTPLPSQKPGQPQQPQTKVSLEDLKPEVDQFVEHVPYENVVSKTFPLKGGWRVCAVNQDLFVTVQRGFEKVNFTVDAVLPGMVLGAGLSAKPVMDGVLANTAIQKAAALKQYDLKSQAAFSPNPKKEEEQVDEVQEALESSTEPPKTNKKRLAVMLGILGILLVVLVIVTIQSMQPPPRNSQQPTLAKQSTSISPMATTTVVEVTETVKPEKLQALSVRIVSSSKTSAAAQSIRSALNAYKFKSLTMQVQNSVASANTVVSFSVNTPQSVRNKVLDEVRKVQAEITVQEREQGTNDIVIIVGE